MKKLNKLGQLGNLQAIVITLVVVGIILGVGFYVLQEFRDTIEEETGDQNSSAYEGVNETIQALLKVPNWLGIIVIIAIVGIIMAILFAVFPRTGATV